METLTKRPSPSKAGISAKKPREGRAGDPAPSAFDQLCDDTLLHILSYSNDLRSLIYLTRGTCKSLRRRFDPKNVSASDEPTRRCSNMWKGIFSDLQLAPPDDADGEPVDYLAEINYRMALLCHGERIKNSDSGIRGLVPRHFHFRHLREKWQWELDDECPVRTPFALMSHGTGSGFVFIHPSTGVLELHESILDNAICFGNPFGKSTAKKRTEDDGSCKSSGVLKNNMEGGSYSDRSMNFDSCSGDDDSVVPIQEIASAMDVEMSAWDRCFGKRTPFFYRGATDDGWGLSVLWSKTGTFGSEGGKKIYLMRCLKDNDDRAANENNLCTEIMVWGNGPPFLLKSITRLPGEWAEVTFSPAGDRLYARIDWKHYKGIVGDWRHTVVEYTLFRQLQKLKDVTKAVFQFPVAPSSYDEGGAHHYPKPICLHLAQYNVTSLLALDTSMVITGGDGFVDIIKFQDSAAPRRLFSVCTFDTPDPIRYIQAVDQTSMQYGFVTMQSCYWDGTVIKLWQPSTRDLATDRAGIARADFCEKAKICYPNTLRPQIAVRGGKLIVLAYESGWLIVDIYLIIGSRFRFDELERAALPKGIRNMIHPMRDEKRLKFVNRISMKHRIKLGPPSVDRGHRLGEPEKFIFDANDRFIVISVNEGPNKEPWKWYAQKIGPGLIIVDLDEHGADERAGEDTKS